MTDYSGMMHKFICDVIDRCGPRPSCSDAEKKAGRMYADAIRNCCDEVRTESFECHPHAFVGFIPFLVPLYFLALVFYWRAPLASVVFMAVLAASFFFEFIRYRRFLDPLFPKRSGENVYGVIRPSGQAKRRIIFAGHLDSAYEFNIWLLFKSAGVALCVLSIALSMVFFAACAGKVIAGNRPEWFFDLCGRIALFGFPLFTLNLVFHTYKPVPGAGDNLSACAVTVGMAKTLAGARKGGGFFPRNTEVVLMGTSSEEAGLRGALAYCEAHMAEMKSLPTLFVSLESFHDENELKIVRGGMTPYVKHPKDVVDDFVKAGKDMGLNIPVVVIPFGAADCAEFQRRGIPSVGVIGIPTKKLPPYYHTRYDTPEVVSPAALQRAMELSLRFLELREGKG
ncbi:MAG TPA: M28 family peptidase [Candidatus Brocadiia bacterium]|nr:M28 family peptidase [Candidatus Brocadiia bacterium]